MKLWVKTLTEPQILVGLCLNYCQKVPVLMCHSEIDTLRDNGHSLIIGSIYDGIIFRDAQGKVGEISVNYPKVTEYLSYIVQSGIEFEIIGDHEELEILRKYSPPVYDKIQSHVIWKARKRGTAKTLHRLMNGENFRRDEDYNDVGL